MLLVLGGAGTAAAISAAHTLEGQSSQLHQKLLLREAEIKTLRYPIPKVCCAWQTQDFREVWKALELALQPANAKRNTSCEEL